MIGMDMGMIVYCMMPWPLEQRIEVVRALEEGWIL